MRTDVEWRRGQSRLRVFLNAVAVDCLALTLRLSDQLSLPASSVFHLVLRPSISQRLPPAATQQYIARYGGQCYRLLSRRALCILQISKIAINHTIPAKGIETTNAYACTHQHDCGPGMTCNPNDAAHVIDSRRRHLFTIFEGHPSARGSPPRPPRPRFLPQ
jgi:hypothetical protein